MKKKLISSIKAFKENGTAQAKVAKLLAVFASTQILLWAILSEDPSPPPDLTPSRHLSGSMMISLPIKLLGTLNPTPPTRMSLKHEPGNLLIPEVFIYGVEWETPQEGIAQVEISPKHLKAILDLGSYQQFTAFPWSTKLLTSSKKPPQPKKEYYEIHLD